MALKDKMPDLSAMSEKEMEAWAASLSPDEMMEFMEYLAGRSGATEGLTRDTSGLEMKAIDETKVTIDGPGYVPFGEENKAKQPEPPAPAVSKQPAPLPPAPVIEKKPEPPPPAPTVPKQPEPAPQPARPEPKPGRTDPPWDVDQPAARTVRVEEAPPARVSVPPPKPPVQPPRVEQAPPVRPAPQQAQPPARVEPPAPARQPAARADSAPARPAPQPEPPASVQQPLIPAAPPAPPSAPAADTSTLAWLESLSSQEEDNLFNLELSGLPTSGSAGSAPVPDNPMNWLEDLSRGGGAPSLELLDEDDDDLGSAKVDPFAAGVDSVSWLDTLAERGGADPDELTTTSRFNIPTTAPDEVEPLSYAPFDFESSTDRSPAITDAPAFLDVLSGAEGYSETGVRATQSDPFSPEAIRQAMADGSVTEEQMRHFLAQQEQDAAEEGVLIDFGDDDGELVPDIPDWLRDMQPTQEAPPAAPTRPLESIFDALPEAPEAIPMPEWLLDDAPIGEATIEDIFDDTPAAASIVIDDVVAPPIEIDPRDPWVEALEAEHTYGAPDLEQEPDWYVTNTHDPDRLAAIDARFGVGQGDVEGIALAQVALPAESSLPFGQEQPIPMWIDMSLIGLVEAAPPPAPPAPAPALLPEDSGWLSEIETPEDVPDWLKDTFPEPEPEEMFVPPEPVVIAPPPVVQPPPVAPRPAAPPPRAPEPVRAPVLDEDVLAVLQGARDLEQAGDIEASLNEYEALIRANRGVDEVVEDLSSLVKSYRTVPAVYRVLGDALMRQGKLQAALNTYREALNQL